MRKLNLFPVVFLLCPFWLSAQIYLTNSSFEGDQPQDATIPAGWIPFKMGTTPDILPGFWGVHLEASEGETYVGLITRNDGSWESIGQRLSAPLKPNECYTVSMDLAYSKTYAGYGRPLRLRIWGGQTKGQREQLLVTSDLIDHADWESYRFKFVTESSLNYLIIEAFHQDGDFSYQGNILIDNIQEIKKCIRAGLDPQPNADGIFRG
ncbi:MAG: hypothetical protein AAGH79_15640 [Bacteroidota bacterium]